MSDREFEVTGVPSSGVVGPDFADGTLLPTDDSKYAQYQENMRAVMTAQDNNWLTRLMSATRNRGLPGPAPVTPTAIPRPALETPTPPPGVRLGSQEYAAWAQTTFGVGSQNGVNQNYQLAQPTTPLEDVTQFAQERTLNDLRVYEMMAATVTGPGYTADNRLAARRVHALVREFPELKDVLQQDFELLMGLSDPEVFVAAQQTLSGQLFSTTNEMMNEYLARNRAGWGLRNSSEVVSLGPWSSKFDLIGDAGLEHIQNRLSEVSGLDAATIQDQKTGRAALIQSNVDRGAYIAEVFGSKDRTTEIFFTPENNRLTAVVTYEDKSTGFIDVQLDGDVLDLDNPLHDALWELALARAGLAHSVVGEENLKGRQTLIGSALELTDVVGDNWDKINGPWNGIVGSVNAAVRDAFLPRTGYEIDWRSSEKRFLEERMTDARRSADQEISKSSDADVILMAALAHQIENGTSELAMSAAAVMPGWDAMSPEEKQAVRDDVYDADELTQAFFAETDDRNSIKRAVDSTLTSVGSKLMFYDAGVQALGSLTVNSLRALGGVVDDLVPGDISGMLGNIVSAQGIDLDMNDLGEGFSRFSAAWDETFENPRVADTLGIEGSARGYVDFASSVLLDPITWFTPGGHGLAQAWTRRIATREGAEQMARSPVRKWRARVAAEAFDSDRLDTVWAMTHMNVDDSLMYSLMDGQLTAATTREAFEDVMYRSHPALGGMALDSLDGVTARNSAENVAKLAKDWNILGPDLQKNLVRHVGWYPAERTVGLSGLHWTDEAGGLFASLAALPNVTQDQVNAWFKEMYQIGADVYRPHSQNRALVADRLTQLRTARDDLVAATPPEVRTFTARLSNAKEQLTAYRNYKLAGRSLPDIDDMITRAEANVQRIEAMRPDFDEFVQRRTALERRIDRDVAHSAKIMSAPVLRDRQGEFLSRVMNEMADSLDWVDPANKSHVGLPYKVDAKGAQLVDDFGQPVRDWTKITGEPRFVGKSRTMVNDLEGGIDNISVASTHAGTAPDAPGWFDKDLATQLRDTGFDTRTIYHLPVSPRQLIAYANFADKKAWKRQFLRSLRESRIQAGFNTLQRVWASSVLLNGTTFLKSNMEEMFRVAGERGIVGKVGRRAVGLQSDYGDELAYAARTPSTIGAAARQNLPLDDIKNSLSASAGSEFRSPMPDKVSMSGYTMVQPSKKPAYRKAQEFWYDGILRGDEVGRRAWAAETFEDFEDWWNTSGKITYSNTGTLNINNGVMTGAVTAREAWNSRQNLLELIVEYADEGAKDSVRNAFRQSARDGSPLSEYAKRQIRQPLPGRSGAVNDNFWDLAFRPYAFSSGRRHSLIHQEYMGDALEALWTAHKGNGTLLTNQRLADIAGVDLLTASRWLENSSWEVEELLKHYGMVTPRQIYDKAGRWAKYRTDNLMYQAGAASVSGKLAQRVFPFGPAQMDFIGYYTKRLRSQMELGLNPKIQKVLKTIPGIGKRIDDIPFVGHAVQPSVMGRRVPLNLRLAARIGEVGGWASYYADQYYKEHPEDDRLEEGAGLLKFLGDATFFPMEPQSYMQQIMFSPGPLPGWAVHLLPDSDDLDENAGIWQKAGAAGRDFFESMAPALEYDRNTYSLTEMDSYMSLLGDFAPTSGRSIPGAAVSAIRWISAMVTSNPDDAKKLYQENLKTLERFGTPPGYNALSKNLVGDALEANGVLPSGSTQWDEMLAGISTEALQRTSTEELQTRANKLALGVGIWTVDDFDGEALPHYAGYMDMLDTVQQLGIVGDSQAQDLQDLWAAANATDADLDTIRAFTDQAIQGLFELAKQPILTNPDGSPLTEQVLAETLPDGSKRYEIRQVDQASWQDLLISLNPGTAINLVSRYRSSLGSDGSPDGPSEYVNDDGSLKIGFGPEGRRVFQQGRAQGWIEEKTLNELAEDANNKVAQANNRAATYLWIKKTGVNRFPGSPANKNYPNRLRDENTLKLTLDENDVRLINSIQNRQLNDPQRRTPGQADRVSELRPGPVSFETLATMVAGLKEQSATERPNFSPRIDQGYNIMKNNVRLEADQEFINAFQANEEEFRRQLEYQGLRFDDLPQEQRDFIHDEFKALNRRGLLPWDDYDSQFEWFYGDPNWEFEPPPPIEETANRMPIGANFSVVDGDTVKVFPTGGEPYRIRLVGINAVDFNTLNDTLNTQALEQRDRLLELIGDGTGIEFAIWEPETFGTYQEVDPKTGERRFLLWLYKDGKPIFDEKVFSESNRAGIASSGGGVPLSYFAVEGALS